MNDVPRTVWITGAGSGMGRASALALAASGHRVALSGRRADHLESVRDEIVAAGGTALAVPLDVTDPAATKEAVNTIAVALGPITAAVFSAGTNVQRRHWATLDLADFERVVATNLTAVTRGIAAVLPGMRERRDGQLVVVSSWAGWTHARGAGVAYSASKTALGSVVATVNDYEGEAGVRACLLCPGDVDTAFIDARPVVPDAAARSAMLSADDIARAVDFVIGSPANVCINELVISPTHNRSYLRT